MSFYLFFFKFLSLFFFLRRTSLCSSPVFLSIIYLHQRTKLQTQVSTKPQTHISSKATKPINPTTKPSSSKENLSLQTNKFSWQINTQKPSKSPPPNQRTWISNPSKRIETQQPTKHHHRIKSSKIFQNFPATSKALTSNPQKS